jgi:hypothetical protein
MMGNPVARLIGADSNVFNLIGIAARALKAAGLRDQAREMTERCFAAHSYEGSARNYWRVRRDSIGVWLEGRDRKFYLELTFTHLDEEGRRHAHDLAVASIEAHQLCHRISRRQEQQLTVALIASLVSRPPDYFVGRFLYASRQNPRRVFSVFGRRL